MLRSEKLNKLSSKQLLRNQKYPKKIIDTDFEKLSKIPIEILRAEKKRIKNLQFYRRFLSNLNNNNIFLTIKIPSKISKILNNGSCFYGL